MMYTKHEKNGILYYTSPLFDRYEIPHMFAARFGGVSKGVFCSLNISQNRKNLYGDCDSPENIRENIRRALKIIERDESTAAMMKQIHSDLVCVAHSTCKEVFDSKIDFQECDGLLSMKGEGRIDTVCVKTADCVPVLLYDIKNDVICGIHAGWRGTVSNICGNAVKIIRKINSDAEIIAAIGPCIQSCCYEVDDKVYGAAMYTSDMLKIDRNLTDSCFAERYFSKNGQKYKASLSGLNRIFLEHAGVKKENISESEMCTCCFKDECECLENVFFSHRASSGHSGTQMSAISLRI